MENKAENMGNEEINWKDLYDILSHKFESKEQELAECKIIIERKKDHAVEQVRGSVLRELFDIRDDLERVHETALQEKGLSTATSGIELVMRRIDDYFTKNNIRRLAAAPGDPFDPAVHEAVETAASPSIPAQHVVRPVCCGYADGPRVFRAARVVVSRGNQ